MMDSMKQKDYHGGHVFRFSSLDVNKKFLAYAFRPRGWYMTFIALPWDMIAIEA